MNAVLHAFASWRMFVVLLLGFSSGIPLALTGATLQAWMTDAHVDLTVIGIFSLVGTPYSFKFLWSPLLDRYAPPFLGRRRGWMLIFQVLLLLGIAGLGSLHPETSTWTIAFMAVIVAFFSSSQDIVVDAYRTEVMLPEELGIGSSIYIMGYRIGMIVSGAAALILADISNWHHVYYLMSLTMLIGIIASLFAPEPLGTRAPKSLQDAVILPFKEFFSRRGWVEILIFIIIYKLDVVIATALTTPFMMELGFTKTDIGAINKGFGIVATIMGTLLGGILMMRWTLKQSLWRFGIFQGVSGLSFIGLAHFGQHYPMLIFSIFMENFCSGMGTAAYSAFLMSLCNRNFTATQYALLTSLMAFSRNFLAAPTGWMAKSMGWEMYFIVSALLMIPGLLMLRRFDHWELPGKPPISPQTAARVLSSAEKTRLVAFAVVVLGVVGYFLYGYFSVH